MELITQVDFKFPPLPTTLGEILEIISSDSKDIDLDRLVGIIERDPAMTAYVLRQANSSYYAVRQYITRIDKAVTFLGFDVVSRIALSAALRQSFTYLEAPATRQIFMYVMQSSLASALLAKEISGFIHLAFPHTTFTAAMLHQLGRLVLLQGVEARYVPLWNQDSAFTVPTIEMERASIRTDYVQVGALTVEKWSLPEELVVVVGNHASPSAVTKPHLRLFAELVAASSNAARHIVLSDSSEGLTDMLMSPVESPSLHSFADYRRITTESLAEFIVSISDSIRDSASAVVD